MARFSLSEKAQEVVKRRRDRLQSRNEVAGKEAIMPKKKKSSLSDTLLGYVDTLTTIKEHVAEIAQERTDMVEPAQAKDALDLAIARLGQTEGLINERK